MVSVWNILSTIYAIVLMSNRLSTVHPRMRQVGVMDVFFLFSFARLERTFDRRREPFHRELLR